MARLFTHVDHSQHSLDAISRLSNTGAGRDRAHDGVKLQNGRAVWYRNRWVRTEALAGKTPMAPAGGPADVDIFPNTSNTSVVAHAGRVFSLAELGLPYEIDTELNTLGRYDFNTRLRATVTAHPKIDPVTGEMFLISFQPMPPYLQYRLKGELLLGQRTPDQSEAVSCFNAHYP